MAVEFLGINLWDLLINQIFGSYLLCIFAIGAIIFLIMGVWGRMSQQTVTYYLMLYLFVFTIGYGYRWLSAIITMVIIFWFINEWRQGTSG